MKKLVPIVIPAYEPDDRLLGLLNDLERDDLGPVIIVNDGSGEDYDKIFEKSYEIIKNNGGTVLAHDVNRGKGRALKTAFEFILNNYSDAIGCVSADCDGQHSKDCINAVSNALIENKDNLIMGVRVFDKENVPFKSRFGNSLTVKIMRFISGVDVKDTQTGLRGIPRAFMEKLLYVKGEHFEFETQMLLESVGTFPIIEVEIETIYDSKENHKTHFNPIVDSFKIYRILGKQFALFLLSSLSSFVVDIMCFTIFCYILKPKIGLYYIATSTVLARIISAIVNYTINYTKVFSSNEKIGKSLLKYIGLAVIIMLLSAFLVTIGVIYIKLVPETLIKVLIDSLLFIVSFKVQKSYIFKKKYD